MFTVDASVWVNAFDHKEPGHQTSRRFLETVQEESFPIFVPHLLRIEVAGAIGRSRSDPTRAQQFATALARLPNVTLLSLDEELAQAALELAAQHALRGADAVYAAVAQQTDCILVSLDQTVLPPGN